KTWSLPRSTGSGGSITTASSSRLGILPRSSMRRPTGAGRQLSRNRCHSSKQVSDEPGAVQPGDRTGGRGAWRVPAPGSGRGGRLGGLRPRFQQSSPPALPPRWHLPGLDPCRAPPHPACRREPTGDLVMPTLGIDSSLARYLRAGEREPIRLGDPLAEPPRVITQSQIRAQALRGEIPVEFRNNVLPVLGPDGELWLVLQGEGVIQRYDADGRQVGSIALPDADREVAREAFFEAWRADEGSRDIHVPWMATAGTVVDGQLWLRLGPGEEGRSVIAVLDGATGRWVRRYALETATPAGPFAVDPERGLLYVSLPDEAVLLRASLP